MTNSLKILSAYTFAVFLALFSFSFHVLAQKENPYHAYRPYAATLEFYKVYPDTNFVAAPWRGSMHNRGCAVDVTLVDLKTKEELEMPTAFDDFTVKAGQFCMDLPSQAIRNRKLLRDIMIKYGFLQYNPEWWHFNFKGWENFELMDISFEELK
jgi:D-alanyl-D-alanine dipeptidase